MQESFPPHATQAPRLEEQASIHAVPLQTLFKQFGSSEHGLTGAEAHKRLGTYGPNARRTLHTSPRDAAGQRYATVLGVRNEAMASSHSQPKDSDHAHTNPGFSNMESCVPG